MQSTYVMSVELAYTDKTQRNEIPNLWHAQLEHVSYHELKMIVEKLMVKGLPEVKVRIDIICVGC